MYASFFITGDSQAGKGEVKDEEHICEQTRGEKMQKNEPDKSQAMCG